MKFVIFKNNFEHHRMISEWWQLHSICASFSMDWQNKICTWRECRAMSCHGGSGCWDWDGSSISKTLVADSTQLERVVPLSLSTLVALPILLLTRSAQEIAVQTNIFFARKAKLLLTVCHCMYCTATLNPPVRAPHDLRGSSLCTRKHKHVCVFEAGSTKMATGITSCEFFSLQFYEYLVLWW